MSFKNICFIIPSAQWQPFFSGGHEWTWLPHIRIAKLLSKRTIYTILYLTQNKLVKCSHYLFNGSNMIVCVCVFLVSNSRGCCLATPGDHEGAVRVVARRRDNTRETERVKSNCARPALSASHGDNEVDHAVCLKDEFQIHIVLSNENGKFYTIMIYPCFSRLVCFSMGSPAWWRFGLSSSGCSLVPRWRDVTVNHRQQLMTSRLPWTCCGLVSTAFARKIYVLCIDQYLF